VTLGQHHCRGHHIIVIDRGIICHLSRGYIITLGRCMDEIQLECKEKSGASENNTYLSVEETETLLVMTYVSTRQ